MITLEQSAQRLRHGLVRMASMPEALVHLLYPSPPMAGLYADPIGALAAQPLTAVDELLTALLRQISTGASDSSSGSLSAPWRTMPSPEQVAPAARSNDSLLPRPYPVGTASSPPAALDPPVGSVPVILQRYRQPDEGRGGDRGDEQMDGGSPPRPIGEVLSRPGAVSLDPGESDVRAATDHGWAFANGPSPARAFPVVPLAAEGPSSKLPGQLPVQPRPTDEQGEASRAFGRSPVTRIGADTTVIHQMGVTSHQLLGWTQRAARQIDGDTAPHVEGEVPREPFPSRVPSPSVQVDRRVPVHPGVGETPSNALVAGQTESEERAFVAPVPGSPSSSVPGAVPESSADRPLHAPAMGELGRLVAQWQAEQDGRSRGDVSGDPVAQAERGDVPGVRSQTSPLSGDADIDAFAQQLEHVLLRESRRHGIVMEDS